MPWRATPELYVFAADAAALAPATAIEWANVADGSNQPRKSPSGVSGIGNGFDNCPLVANADQKDSDYDHYGLFLQPLP